MECSKYRHAHVAASEEHCRSLVKASKASYSPIASTPYWTTSPWQHFLMKLASGNPGADYRIAWPNSRTHV